MVWSDGVRSVGGSGGGGGREEVYSMVWGVELGGSTHGGGGRGGVETNDRMKGRERQLYQGGCEREENAENVRDSEEGDSNTSSLTLSTAPSTQE